MASFVLTRAERAMPESLCFVSTTQRNAASAWHVVANIPYSPAELCQLRLSEAICGYLRLSGEHMLPADSSWQATGVNKSNAHCNFHTLPISLQIDMQRPSCDLFVSRWTRNCVLSTSLWVFRQLPPDSQAKNFTTLQFLLHNKERKFMHMHLHNSSQLTSAYGWQ